MPGRERVFALDVPGNHVFSTTAKDVDGRDKPGHDEPPVRRQDGDPGIDFYMR